MDWFGYLDYLDYLINRRHEENSDSEEFEDE